jgi:hypothetical protein
VPQRRARCRCTLEFLEPRMLLSGNVPANTIGVAQGVVPAPRAVGHASVTVAPNNLAQNRHSTVFALRVFPNQGSPLRPHVVNTQGVGASRLPLRQGAPFNPDRHPFAMAYTLNGQPGPLTTGVTGTHATTGAFTEQAELPGDANGDGHVDFADLQAFPIAFKSHINEPNYNPALDANHNGFIGQGDARFLERNLSPITQRIPLEIRLHLAPGEQVLHPDIHNSGGITLHPDITIVGQTTPGAIVFSDSEQGNFTFDGAALATDANGNFAQHFHLTERLTNFEFLAIDPFGQQTIRSFPIRWLAP